MPQQPAPSGHLVLKEKTDRFRNLKMLQQLVLGMILILILETWMANRLGQHCTKLQRLI